MLHHLDTAARMRMGLVIITIAMLPISGPSHAGASLFVDDAAVTSRGRCQFENWLRAYSPGQELTATPACNVGGTELGVGISRFANPSLGPILNPGAKRLLRERAVADVPPQRAAAGMTAVPHAMSPTTPAWTTPACRPGAVAIHAGRLIDRSHAHV